MEAAEDRSYCPMCNAVFRTPFARCPLDGAVLAELDVDPLINTVLDKRYQIEECIGEGGMGRVYRAKHVRMSRMYAIKILFGDHAGNTRMRSRFAREAEAVSRLNHTNVISVVDFGETSEGLLYLVMDLADGSPLAEIVHEQAPLDPARALKIIAQLLKGLAHAHGHGLVHRDFKCENVIMVTEEGLEVPKIVDFGICMIVEDQPSSTMLTSNGMIMGTPAVMAPEQASGDQVDHRTDLFSLGIVGYQMLSGMLPFDGTPLDMARKNLYEEIPLIRDRCGVDVAPGIQALITKLTAKKPENRYQSANDVLSDLQPLLGMDWSPLTPLPAQPLPLPAKQAFSQVSSPTELSDSIEATRPDLLAHIGAGLALDLQSTAITNGSAIAVPAATTTARPQTEAGRLDFLTSAENAPKKRKPIVFAILGVAALALLFVVIFALRSSSDDSSSESLALNQADLKSAPIQSGSGTNENVDSAPPEPVVPVDVETVPEATVAPVKKNNSTATGTQKDTQTKPPKLLPKKPKKSNKPNKLNKPKPKPKPTMSVSELKNANLSLHTRIGTRLNRLSSMKGINAAKSFRGQYSKISRSVIIHTKSITGQQRWSKKLRALMKSINRKLN